jgi:predicted acetyltransferase
VTFSTRRLGSTDMDASLQLSTEAFGERATPAPITGPPTDKPTPAWPPEGVVGLGAFDDGRLVAKLNGRPYDSWFHGSRVPTFGIAGVTVSAEHRGEGLLTPLMTQILDEARAQGAAISTLFPTAPGIYRRFGYELISALTTVSVPTAVLQHVRRPDGIRTRRASEGDFDAVRACYDRWGADRNGPLTRDGVMFPADAAEWLGDFTAVTLAVDEGDVVQGFASWKRGQGYGPDATIAAEDLIWTSGSARDALLATLGSFSAVTGMTRIGSSGTAELDLALPVTATSVVERAPYMLRVLDVPAAFGAIRPGTEVTGSTTFSVAGDDVGRTNGTYRLEVGGGAVRCAATEGGAVGDVTFSPRGLALTWGGALPLRRVVADGRATAGNNPANTLWDALGLARPLHIRDYF